jgi:SAM-dependent methyltransferase
MISKFRCPVCKADQWNKIERFKYLNYEHKRNKINNIRIYIRYIKIVFRIIFFAKPSTKMIQCYHLDYYQKLRRQVLFDVWFPRKNEVILQSKVCENCGFMVYDPRPEDSDIKNKYLYLREIHPDIGGQEGHSELANALDRNRSFRIFQSINSHFESRSLKVLDYGGGNGRLLIPFLEEGHNCFLVDYSENTISEVKKLGNDINDIDKKERFDVIICSHVLEHVAEPNVLIGELRRHLKTNGIIYAEVPLEIWTGLRIDADPVTHINFFTPNSFRTLFINNHFRLLDSVIKVSNYADSFMEVIWIIGEKTTSKEKNNKYSMDTEFYLFPSRFYSISKLSKIMFMPFYSKYKIFLKSKLKKKLISELI